MLKKTVTVENVFTGEEMQEDVYMHLTEAELTEFSVGYTDGTNNIVEEMVAANDLQGIVRIIKEIILAAYGKKEGNAFVKSKDGRRYRDEFESSEAFSKVFMEIISDEKAQGEFLNNIVPKKIADQLKDKLPEIKNQDIDNINQ